MRVKGTTRSRWIPASLRSGLWQHRDLSIQLCRREIAMRYRGSILGWAWSLATPLLTLAVYTFVFSEVFQSRWAGQGLNTDGKLLFAVNLFTGLITFNIFSETITSSPGLVLRNANLTTKVIFPLETLSVASVAAALINAISGLSILLLFELVAQGSIPPTTAWLPIVWTPLAAGCLGLSWMLSALGVYIRDLQQVSSVAANLLLFLSAVFYPVQALPDRWQPLLMLNPLAQTIEQTRRVLVLGMQPSPTYLATALAIGLITCEIGYRGFQRARRGFADVL